MPSWGTLAATLSAPKTSVAAATEQSVQSRSGGQSQVPVLKSQAAAPSQKPPACVDGQGVPPL